MSKLPKPRFNLKSPNAKKETLIFIVLRYRGKKLLYSTGLNILPSEWDFKSQRPIEKERRLDLSAIRQQLDNIVSLCMSIFIDADYGNLKVTEFKDRLDSALNGSDEGKKEVTDSSERPEFFEFAWAELAEMKATRTSMSSHKWFKLQLNNLQKFADYRGDFTYEDVDWNFRLELIDWLSEKNIQLGYGNKTLKILRQFLERARRKKLHNNTDYNGYGWTVPAKKAKGQTVILNVEELQMLSELKLKGFHKKVRDLFLVGAGTGQRFSDFSCYTPDHFYKTVNGVPLLSLVSQKTATPTVLPLNIFPWLIPILEEYEYSSPKLSMQKLNTGIKEVCDLAGLHDKVLKVEQFFGRRPRIVKTYIPRFLEVSSHTCRRSFATNLYRMGYRLSQIMQLTGHATEAQLQEYIGINGEETAESIALEIMAKSRENGEKPKLKSINS